MTALLQMLIQNHLLASFDAALAPPKSFTERHPLDREAYTIATIPKGTQQKQVARIAGTR